MGYSTHNFGGTLKFKGLKYEFSRNKATQLDGVDPWGLYNLENNQPLVVDVIVHRFKLDQSKVRAIETIVSSLPNQWTKLL